MPPPPPWPGAPWPYPSVAVIDLGQGLQLAGAICNLLLIPIARYLWAIERRLTILETLYQTKERN